MTFKYIPNDNTLVTAADAATLSSIDLGGVFKGQEKRSSFQLGNTGAAVTNFAVTIAGGESGITDNVELSLDGNTWTASVSVPGIKPNDVTDLIHVRYTPDADDFTTNGTFLLNVVES